MQSIVEYIKDPYQIFEVMRSHGITNVIPDKMYLNIIFRRLFRKNINWSNPQSYNEKIQWLKIYNRKPLYSVLVDKYEVKKYVANKIGDEYIIPTLGIWDRFDDIDFENLPDQFVLKCTHDSGGIVICRDKRKFDVQKAREVICRSLSKNYYYRGREWPYKNVKPRIIAEQYMEDQKTGELRDYKFFVFDGKVKALYIASQRQSESEETKFDFFDEEFNHLDFTNGHPNATNVIEKPVCFDKMKELASVLSSGILHVRVDFYEVNGKVLFGEFTFFHMGGFMPFKPNKWDYTFGEWLKLPK